MKAGAAMARRLIGLEASFLNWDVWCEQEVRRLRNRLPADALWDEFQILEEWADTGTMIPLEMAYAHWVEKWHQREAGRHERLDQWAAANRRVGRIAHEVVSPSASET